MNTRNNNREPAKNGQISKYFLRSVSDTVPFSATSTVEVSNMADSRQSSSNSKQMASKESKSVDKMDKILTALASLENKLDTKVDQIKQDLDKRFDEVLDQIAGMERSLNFTQKEVNDLKEEHCKVQADTKKLREEVDSCRRELWRVENAAKEKLNEFERRSHEYNIRIHGLINTNGETNYKKLVAKALIENHLVPDERSLVDTMGTIEIAHPLAKKSQYIARLYSRPCRNGIIQEAKSRLNKETGKDGLKVYEDFTKTDYDLKQRAIPQMRAAYAEGNKVRFHRGRLTINGKNVAINNPEKD